MSAWWLTPASLKRKGRKKSDKIDAEKLVRWARSDPEILESVQHPGADIQADMAVVHSRRALVVARTKLINRARGLVKSWGARPRTMPTTLASEPLSMCRRS